MSYFDTPVRRLAIPVVAVLVLTGLAACQRPRVPGEEEACRAFDPGLLRSLDDTVVLRFRGGPWVLASTARDSARAFEFLLRHASLPLEKVSVRPGRYMVETRQYTLSSIPIDGPDSRWCPYRDEVYPDTVYVSKMGNDVAD